MNAATSLLPTETRPVVMYRTAGDGSTIARVVDPTTGKVLGVHSNRDQGRLYRLIRDRYLSR